jgi:histidine triad (HIT) family protein
MYDKNNVFAKILSGAIPSEIIFQNEYVAAFMDIAPVAPIHLLIIPKIEAVDYEDFVEKASLEVLKGYFLSIKEIAESLGITDYRLVSNKGGKAGQTVFHFHMHLIASEDLSSRPVA